VPERTALKPTAASAQPAYVSTATVATRPARALATSVRPPRGPVRSSARAVLAARAAHPTTARAPARTVHELHRGLGLCLPAVCDNNQCTGGKAPGEACTDPSQCRMGFCTDGVCCDQLCSEPCKSCLASAKGAGLDGNCGPVLAGADPDNDCAPEAAATCQRDGQCDGLGRCRLYGKGTSCGSSQCLGNTARGLLCDGLGSCEPDSNGVDCGFFLCANGGCKSSCLTAADCVSPLGATGWLAKPCVTGRAVYRAGPVPERQLRGRHLLRSELFRICLSCLASGKGGGEDGVCGAAKDGTDPRGECPDDGAPSCGRDGQCDGSARCRLYGPGTLCASPQCDNNAATNQSFSVGKSCDGLGSCEAASSDCGQYQCVGGGCKTSCGSNADCVQTAWCEGGTCQQKRSNGRRARARSRVLAATA